MHNLRRERNLGEFACGAAGASGYCRGDRARAIALGSLVVDEIKRFIEGLPLEHAITAETLHLQA